MKRAAPIAAALLGAVLLTALVFHTIRLRTDITGFLPQGRTEASRFMLDELRSGATAGLVLIGIEGAPPETLARISREMAEGMKRSGEFRLVAGGESSFSEADEAFLFGRRYLLSDVTKPDAFTAPALRQDLQTLLRELQSSATPLIVRYGIADPPGAFFDIARNWIGGGHIRTVNGAWFAPERDRALILARLRAGGMDVAAEDRALDAAQAAFNAAHPGEAKLLLAGPAVIARNAAQGVRRDVEFLSTLSSVMVAALLFWRFRSVWVVAAIAVPVLLSLDAAAAAVQLAFGQVQGAAFGFGMTMLGVTVDYPVLLIGHRKAGEEARGTLRRIGRTLTLAVLAAALGLTGMVFCGFPGLAQIGLFSAVGVLAAAAATRFLLPPLIVAADLAPVASGSDARLLRIEGWRRGRLLALLPVGAATVLLVLRPPHWQADLAQLSPAAAQDEALDRTLRGELGAPDTGVLLVAHGPSAEAVLQMEEHLKPELERLRRNGALAGAEYAARFLPSMALQRQRQAALPDAPQLRAALDSARAGSPFREDAFAPFLEAVAANRSAKPLEPADISSEAAAARLSALLSRRGDSWFGAIAPQELKDPGALAALAAQGLDPKQGGVFALDMRHETSLLVSAATRRAWRWLGLGALGVLIALVAGLRHSGQVLRVVSTIWAALLVTVAALAALGTQFSLLHIVALQFVAGIGLDYALFFARRQLDDEERARTLRTLVTCNAMTLLTFGALACCRTPLLREIGLTVAIGAFSAMCLAFLVAGPRPPRRAPPRPSGVLA